MIAIVDYGVGNLFSLSSSLSYLGLEADTLRRFVRDHRLTGIDRIAPVGATMDFALTWDGIDLIRTLSRSILTI